MTQSKFAVFVLISFMAFFQTAWASNQGCTSHYVEAVKTASSSTANLFDNGMASQVDLVLSKVQLADAQICAGLISEKTYCDAKTALLNHLLEVRQRLFDSGMIFKTVV